MVSLVESYVSALLTSFVLLTTALFNQSLREGKVPDDWKQQRVSPVLKKGSRSVPANYRPVALTRILCKMLEHVFCSKINKHLSTHSGLAQHGFRAKRSCESQLLTTTNDLNPQPSP